MVRHQIDKDNTFPVINKTESQLVSNQIVGITAVQAEKKRKRHDIYRGFIAIFHSYTDHYINYYLNFY